MNEPHKVATIVAENPDVLYETYWVGENILHWLAVENRHEEIGLLRSLGSPIPVYALVEAVDHVHTETSLHLLRGDLSSNQTPIRQKYQAILFLTATVLDQCVCRLNNNVVLFICRSSY